MASRRSESAAWQRLYKTSRWLRLREAQLSDDPLCRFCLAIEEVTEATVCDHVIPHKGSIELFHDPMNLQSLCTQCHDRLKARIEAGKKAVIVGVDGYPVEVGG